MPGRNTPITICIESSKKIGLDKEDGCPGGGEAGRMSFLEWRRALPQYVHYPFEASLLHNKYSDLFCISSHLSWLCFLMTSLPYIDLPITGFALLTSCNLEPTSPRLVYTSQHHYYRLREDRYLLPTPLECNFKTWHITKRSRPSFRLSTLRNPLRFRREDPESYVGDVEGERKAIEKDTTAD